MIEKIFSPIADKGMAKISFFIGFLLIPLSLVFDACAAGDAMQKEIKKIEAAESVTKFSIARPTVSYQAFSLKDPFLGRKKIVASGDGQVEVSEIQPPVLNIQGIVWGGDIPQAIIDGKVVRIGDIVANAHIVDISQKGVDIFFEGRQFSIPAPAAASRSPEPQLSSKGGTNVQ